MIKKTPNVNFETTKAGNQYKKAKNGAKIGALVTTAVLGSTGARGAYRTINDMFVQSGLSTTGARNMTNISIVIGLGIWAGIGALAGKCTDAIINKVRQNKADKAAATEQ